MPELTARLRNRWGRLCERELHRRRGRLQALDLQLQQDLLADLMNALLRPLLQYAQSAPAEEQAQLAQVLTLLFGSDLEENRVAQG